MPNADAERVMALIRKAISTSSVEEARTCALTAVQHIVQKKLTVVDPNDLPKPVGEKKRTNVSGYSQPQGTRPSYRRPPTAPSRVSFNTKCMICQNPLHAGQEVFWSPAFQQAICAGCFETEILDKG